MIGILQQEQPSLSVAYLVLLGLILLILFLLLILQIREDQTKYPEPDQMTDVVETAFDNSDVHQSIGRIDTLLSEFKELHTDINQMLHQPQSRGRFGEFQLEQLLDDHLPESSFSLQRELPNGRRPDAIIETSAGLLPIDSKFPLSNYKAYIEAETESGRSTATRSFRQDVEAHLEAIASKYVQADNRTTDFAIAFIPSESVYHYLVTEEWELLNEYSHRGVQIGSPLTIGHKLQLIHADLHSRQLSEEAAEIAEELTAVANEFESFEESWSTLQRHIRNADSKATEVNRDFDSLRSRFETIESRDFDASLE